MSDDLSRPGIHIFAGRFGSGKTEVALNYARALAARPNPGGTLRPATPAPGAAGVVLIDLDIVTPYFRSRETADRMREQGIEVVAPSVIGQYLDTPAITPQILGAIEQSQRPVVLDVGGDKQGARALGQFSAAIQKRGYIMHLVVNPYRPFTSTAEGVATAVAEIEETSRLRVTGLVSNPNLMGETTSEHIVQGHARIVEFGQHLDLPVSFLCVERRWAEHLSPGDVSQPLLLLDRYFVQPWERP